MQKQRTIAPTEPKIRFQSYDELRKLSELEDSPYQRNKHTKEQIERLAFLMREEGVIHPIHVRRGTNRICFGHGRRDAALLNGWTEFPVVYQDFDDEEQEYRMVQSDNAIASWSELDLSAINLDLQDLGPFDIDLLGIKDFEVEPADKYADKDADSVPEVKESFVKRGDLWILGNHRLLCGDATSKEDVEQLMNGEKADMVYTDPPYGMNLDTDYSTMHKGGKKYKAVIGDDKDFDPSHLFDLADEVFLWGADYYCQSLPKHGSWIVWNKVNSSKYEGTETVNTIGNNFELCWSKQSHKRVIRNCIWRGSIYNEGKDEERRPGTSVLIRHHPTQKPIKLFSDMISQYSKEGQLILDLYLGSGSTLIACEKTNRKCFGMEIDPHYCSVIIERWQKFTGQKAVKI